MSDKAATKPKQPWQAPDWPRAMKKQTAAAYCDLSVRAFEREVARGGLPRSFRLGGREHWDRSALDVAFDRIFGGTYDPEPEHLRRFRERHERAAEIRRTGVK